MIRGANFFWLRDVTSDANAVWLGQHVGMLSRPFQPIPDLLSVPLSSGTASIYIEGRSIWADWQI